MTKEQMLDIVNLKMAPTSYSDGGTGCFLPVMIGDVLDWIEKNPSKKPKAPITAKLSLTSETVTKMKIDVYWKEKNLERIVTYCQKDVVTVAQILLRMNGEQLIKEENIEIK